MTVINESFAKQMWPGQSAIGKHVTTSYTGTAISRAVVGVIREAKLTSVTGSPPAAIFVPLEQHSSAQPGGVLVIRATGNPANIVPQVRRIATELDPQVAVTRVETMQDVVDGSLAQPIRLRFFLTLFAALALVLGAVGVYGVVSARRGAAARRVRGCASRWERRRPRVRRDVLVEQPLRPCSLRL